MRFPSFQWGNRKSPEARFVPHLRGSFGPACAGLKAGRGVSVWPVVLPRPHARWSTAPLGRRRAELARCLQGGGPAREGARPPRGRRVGADYRRPASRLALSLLVRVMAGAMTSPRPRLAHGAGRRVCFRRHARAGWTHSSTPLACCGGEGWRPSSRLHLFKQGAELRHCRRFGRIGHD